jgi:hypothetical protein
MPTVNKGFEKMAFNRAVRILSALGAEYWIKYDNQSLRRGMAEIHLPEKAEVQAVVKVEEKPKAVKRILTRKNKANPFRKELKNHMPKVVIGGLYNITCKQEDAARLRDSMCAYAIRHWGSGNYVSKIQREKGMPSRITVLRTA